MSRFDSRSTTTFAPGRPGWRWLWLPALLVLTLLSKAEPGWAQAKAAAQPPAVPLLARLPLLPLPLRLDSALQVRPVPVSRREVWEALVRPLQGYRPDSTEWSEEFPVDSASILDYHQWAKLDRNRREPTIDFYSPIFSGRLFVIGKVALAGGVTGVLWGFQQRDAIYGAGPIYWLVLPGSRAGRAEFRTVYQRQRSDAGTSQPNRFTLRAELQAAQLTLWRRNVWYPLIGEKPGPPKVEGRRQTFAITPQGLREQR